MKAWEMDWKIGRMDVKQIFKGPLWDESMWNERLWYFGLGNHRDDKWMGANVV